MRAIAVLVLCIVPSAVASDAAPSDVSAVYEESSVAISWTPVVDAVEYVVYGVEDGIEVELTSTMANSAVVPSGYQKYGVSIRDGVIAYPTKCIYTDPQANPPVYSGECPE